MTALSRSAPPRRRQGFTLVEVLVAMALIIFIMVILTEAFTAGIGVFRSLKAAGDMQERLRTAESLLRDDLVHYHLFDGNPGVTSQPIKLSALSATMTNPPAQGYFFIQQNASFDEGVDGTGVHSWRMNAAPPVMCFTVNYNKPPNIPPAQLDKGYLPSDFFVGRLPLPLLTADAKLTAAGPVDYQPPATTPGFISQWAEVGYFLVATGRQAGTTTQMPLYSLRRRIRAIAVDPMQPTLASDLTGAAIPASPNWGSHYAEISCYPTGTTLTFPSPSDLFAGAATTRPMVLTIAAPPLGPTTGPAVLGDAAHPNSLGQTDGPASWQGDDLVISDVISFNVRVLPQPPSNSTTGDFLNVPDFMTLMGSTGNTYSTGPSTLYPMSALEITIRVWDVKTNLARQLTIVQDM
jgi:prepilin-type N-terminal cleavage/methylation domain-containing protein